MNILKHYPLTLLCTIAIWILSLIPIPETPLDDVAFIDKWTHLVMYGTLTLLLGAEMAHNNHTISLKQFIIRVLPWPALMGGLVEIVQATCTNGVRSGDWLDFLADAIGGFLGFAIAIFAWLYYKHKA